MKVLVTSNVRYANGQVARYQDVLVVGRGTSTPASLSSDNLGTPLANPVKTDGTGNVSFYVDTGSYDYLVNGTRIPFDALDSEASPAFSHHQVAPAASWPVVHGRGVPVEPTVLLDDDPTVPVYPDLVHSDANTTVIIFPVPVSGWAHFS